MNKPGSSKPIQMTGNLRLKNHGLFIRDSKRNIQHRRPKHTNPYSKRVVKLYEESGATQKVTQLIGSMPFLKPDKEPHRQEPTIIYDESEEDQPIGLQNQMTGPEQHPTGTTNCPYSIPIHLLKQATATLDDQCKSETDLSLLTGS